MLLKVLIITRLRILERSATADGMRALITIIYAVPNMPDTFLRAGNMVNESKLAFVDITF